MYTMQGKRAFTLAYSEGFRAPSLSELYLKHTSSYGLTLQGNPSVLPEKVQAYEVMYELLTANHGFGAFQFFIIDTKT